MPISTSPRPYDARAGRQGPSMRIVLSYVIAPTGKIIYEYTAMDPEKACGEHHGRGREVEGGA